MTEDSDYRQQIAQALVPGGEESTFGRLMAIVSPLVEQLRQARGLLDYNRKIRGRVEEILDEELGTETTDETQHGYVANIGVVVDRLRQARADLREFDGAAFDNQRLTGDLIVQQGVSRDLRADLARLRLAWQSAARGRMRARIERDTLGECMPCTLCDDTGIAPEERFGRDTDGAPMVDGDQPCPEGCPVRRDIAYLQDAVAEYDRHAPACLRERDQLRADLETRTRERDEARQVARTANNNCADFAEALGLDRDCYGDEILAAIAVLPGRPWVIDALNIAHHAGRYREPFDPFAVADELLAAGLAAPVVESEAADSPSPAPKSPQTTAPVEVEDPPIWIGPDLIADAGLKHMDATTRTAVFAAFDAAGSGPVEAETPARPIDMGYLSLPADMQQEIETEPSRDEVVAEWAATWDGVDRSGLPGGPVVARRRLTALGVHDLDDVAAEFGVDLTETLHPTSRFVHVTTNREIPEGHTGQRVRYQFEDDTWEGWLIGYGTVDEVEEAYVMDDDGVRWVQLRSSVTEIDSPPVASPGTGTEAGEK